MLNPNGIYVHGPNEKNSLVPYFPPETIESCRGDFKQVLSHFPKSLVRKLRTALLRREVDGSFAWSDLLGTLAKSQDHTGRIQIAQKRLELYEKIGRTPGVQNNNFEYWFFQISGQPSLGSSVNRHLCKFTEKTTIWCEEVIKSRRR